MRPEKEGEVDKEEAREIGGGGRGGGRGRNMKNFCPTKS